MPPALHIKYYDHQTYDHQIWLEYVVLKFHMKCKANGVKGHIPYSIFHADISASAEAL